MIIDTTKPTQRTQEEIAADYAAFAGKCKALAEEAIVADPTLRLVRGYYYCPIWGQRGHWWCETAKGEVFDPSVRQFPTMGFAAVYEEFDGFVDCSQCGKKMKEEEASFDSNYAFCSTECHGRFVGVY